MIEISGLKAGYKGRPVLALDGLRVAAGEHTLILGPSGCGKTTLLNIISGIAVPEAGEVSVNGVRLEKLSAAERDHFRGRHVGFVMQRLHLISALSVAGNLQLAQKLAGASVEVERIGIVLNALGIAGKAKASPAQLSQGEAQRVAIARAVINRPTLILADEPTAALDDDNCEAAIDILFAQAADHGATLVAATHDQRIKARFTRVLILAKLAT